MASAGKPFVILFALGCLPLLGCSGDNENNNPDACDSVTCSGHGQCVLDAGQAVCQCEPGYHSVGTQCKPKKDQEPPVFSKLVIHPTAARAGETVLLYVSTSEELRANPNVSVDGYRASFQAINGLSYTYSYRVLGHETEGLVRVRVVGTDRAGLQGSIMGDLQLDFTGPTHSDIWVSKAYAKKDDVVTIRFTAAEMEAGSMVSVGSSTAKFVEQVDLEHTYSYTVVGNEIEGPTLVNVLARDAVGNLDTTTATASVVLDYTPPTIADISTQKTAPNLAFQIDLASYLKDNITPDEQLKIELLSQEGSISGSIFSHTWPAQTTATVQIRVSDEAGNGQNGSFVVKVEQPNGIPVARIALAAPVRVTETATLSGTGSTDPDADTLTYAWTFASRPTGSAAAFSDPNKETTSFVADKPGTYELQLIVNDGQDPSAPAGLTIPTTNSPPLSDAGDDISIILPDPVVLDGSNSSDVDADALSYLWSWTQRPQGSTAAFTSTNKTTTSFAPDRGGLFIAQLEVSDGQASDVDTVSIQAPWCNFSPSVTWHQPDAWHASLSPARPPNKRAVAPAGNIGFTAGTGYTFEKQARVLFTDGNQIVYYAPSHLLQKPQLTYANAIREVNLSSHALRFSQHTGWSVFDPDDAFDQMDAEYGSVAEEIPGINGQEVSKTGDAWGLLTTWRSALQPPLAEEFIPFKDPVHGLPDSLIAGRPEVADSLWTQNNLAQPTSTRYVFLRKKILTIHQGDVYVDQAGDLPQDLIGNQYDLMWIFTGQVEGQISVFLRYPNGDRKAMMDSTSTFNITLDFDPVDFVMQGDYWLEVYASTEIFQAPAVLPCQDDMESYNQQGLAESFNDWTFHQGAWEIADSGNLPAPTGDNILSQITHGTAAAAVFGQAVTDVEMEFLWGKAAGDDGELRVWLRALDDASGIQSGYYLFIYDDAADRSTDQERIGIARHNGTTETILVHNKQTTPKAVALNTWWIHNNTGIPSGANTAYHIKIRATALGDELTFLVSPPNTEALGEVGTDAGQTLKLFVTDATYASGKVGMESTKAAFWLDLVDYHSLKAPWGGLRIDEHPNQILDFVNSANIQTVDRYLIVDGKVKDRFGSGYDEVLHTISPQKTNADKNPWSLPDNYSFKDYVLDPANAVVVDSASNPLLLDVSTCP
jgi:hypothetical protein